MKASSVTTPTPAAAGPKTVPTDILTVNRFVVYGRDAAGGFTSGPLVSRSRRADARRLREPAFPKRTPAPRHASFQ